MTEETNEYLKELAKLYKKIKNGECSIEEKMKFELELGRSCMAPKYLIKELEKLVNYEL